MPRDNRKKYALSKRKYQKWKIGRKLPPLADLPKNKLVRLRYCEGFTLDPALSSLDVHYYKANGMYDPTVAVGGHQPRGFDQTMLGYEHFTVIGSKCTVSIQPVVSGQVSDAQTPMVWGVALVPTPSIGGIADASSMIESRLSGGKYRLGGVNTAAGSGVNQPSMTRNFSATKFFHKKSLTGQGQFSGNTLADPTELAYFAVWGGPADGAAVNPDGQNMFIQIDYLAVLSEPKILAES